jgi:hypothetical protein
VQILALSIVLSAVLSAALSVACSSSGGGDDTAGADAFVPDGGGRDVSPDVPRPPDVAPDDAGDDAAADLPTADVVQPPPLWRVRSLGADGRSLHGAWCAAPGDCLAVGDGGLLLAQRGTGWLPRDTGTTAPLRAIGALGDGTVVIVGEAATLLRESEDGGWEPLCDGACRALTPDGFSGFRAVWGTRVDLFFVAGDAGTVLRYEDGTWHHEPTGITSRLLAIWGEAATDLYVAGERGKLLHRSGDTWTALDVLSSTGSVYALWATSANDVWAAGSDGRILRRRQGGQWATLATNDTQDRTIRALWGAAENRIWAAGEDGVVLFWNGERWNLQDVTGPNGRGATFQAIAAAAGPGGAVTVTLLGEDGLAVGRNENATWTDRTAGPTQAVRGVWGPDGGSRVFAVGDGGVVLEGLLAGASPVALVPSGTQADLFAVGGAGPEDVWAVGEGGTTLHRDAAGWSPVPAEAADGAGLRGVWVSPDGAALAVGDVGTVLRWDGAAWLPEPSGVLVRLEAVHGRALDDAWAVTEDGRVLHRTATGWQTADQPVGSALRAVWQAPDGTVWAVGDNGVVLRGGPGGFDLVAEASGTFLYGLHGTVAGGATRVVAVGWAGEVLVLDADGSAVTEDSGTFQELRAVHVWSAGAVALGRGGVFVERTEAWQGAP